MGDLVYLLDTQQKAKFRQQNEIRCVNASPLHRFFVLGRKWCWEHSLPLVDQVCFLCSFAL